MVISKFIKKEVIVYFYLKKKIKDYWAKKRVSLVILWIYGYPIYHDCWSLDKGWGFIV